MCVAGRGVRGCKGGGGLMGCFYVKCGSCVLIHIIFHLLSCFAISIRIGCTMHFTVSIYYNQCPIINLRILNTMEFQYP